MFTNKPLPMWMVALIVVVLVLGPIASSLHCKTDRSYLHGSQSIDVCCATICLSVLIGAATLLVVLRGMMTFTLALITSMLSANLLRFDPPPKFSAV
mgnify:CR=1 FL=1